MILTSSDYRRLSNKWKTRQTPRGSVVSIDAAPIPVKVAPVFVRPCERRKEDRPTTYTTH